MCTHVIVVPCHLDYLKFWITSRSSIRSWPQAHWFIRQHASAVRFHAKFSHPFSHGSWTPHHHHNRFQSKQYWVESTACSAGIPVQRLELLIFHCSSFIQIHIIKVCWVLMVLKSLGLIAAWSSWTMNSSLWPHAPPHKNPLIYSSSTCGSVRHSNSAFGGLYSIVFLCSILKNTSEYALRLNYWSKKSEKHSFNFISFHIFPFYFRERLLLLLEEDKQEKETSLKAIKEYTDLVSENVWRSTYRFLA